MFRTRNFRIIVGVALLGLAAMIGPAGAANPVNLDNPAFLASGGATSIPVGHAEFCASHRDECGLETNMVRAEALTQANWRQLLEINARFNTAIKPMTDEALYHTAEFWTYPQTAGDCEDYVLAKRRALIQAGWPASTLLITVVRQANGEGHAVLLARTDRGDFVLDNQDGLVKLWSDTRYQFIKRQSQVDAGQWVSLIDPRPLTLIASL